MILDCALFEVFLTLEDSGWNLLAHEQSEHDIPFSPFSSTFPVYPQKSCISEET